MAVVLGTMVFASPRAFAADAQINSYDIAYTMQTSGVLQVKETIDYRFGGSSARHGIERSIITREPDAGDNADKDIVYTINNFRVQQPGLRGEHRRQDDDRLQRRRPQVVDQLPDRQHKPRRSAPTPRRTFSPTT